MKKKVIHILRMIFGYAILAVLFGGGATFSAMWRHCLSEGMGLRKSAVLFTGSLHPF